MTPPESKPVPYHELRKQFEKAGAAVRRLEEAFTESDKAARRLQMRVSELEIELRRAQEYVTATEKENRRLVDLGRAAIISTDAPPVFFLTPKNESPFLLSTVLRELKEKRSRRR